MIQPVISIFKTLLPSRYRHGDIPRSMAVVCGVGQTLASLAALIARSFSWLEARTFVDPHGASVLGGLSIPGSGIFLLAEFWFNPLHIFLFYMMIEGMVRTLAAVVSHQIIGTLPLYVVSGLHGLLNKFKYKLYVGPLVVDQVIRGGEKQGYDLKVYSCRPKAGWNPYMTIEFENDFYQYFKEEQGPPPRRFVYYLRKNPLGRIVVVVDHYKIDDVMKRDGTSRF